MKKLFKIFYCKIISLGQNLLIFNYMLVTVLKHFVTFILLSNIDQSFDVLYLKIFNNF